MDRWTDGWMDGWVDGWMDRDDMGTVGMVVDTDVDMDGWEIASVYGVRLILREDPTTEPGNGKPPRSHSYGLEEVSPARKGAAGSSPAYATVTLAFPWGLHPPSPLRHGLTAVLVQKPCTDVGSGVMGPGGLPTYSEVGDLEGHLVWTQLWLRWLQPGVTNGNFVLAKQTGSCTQLLVDLETLSS